MSFQNYSRSAQDSRPDELYDFVYDGDNSHYRVTSSAFEIEFDDGGGAETYTPIPISRTKAKNTGEPEKNGITLTVSNIDNAYFNRFIVGTFTFKTTVTIYELQPDDTYAVRWSGYIKNVSRNSTAFSVVCGSIANDINKPIMHRKFQKECPHKLYGYYCGVNRVSYTHTGTLDAVDGVTLESTTFGTQDDGYFASGEITVGTESKTIIDHVGDVITLLDPFYDVEASDSFTAYAGCDHSMEGDNGCDVKFSNSENYGGCQWIPDDDNIQNGKSITY